MAQCWPLVMPPTVKAVLISIADQANDDGVCWPSVKSMCQRTCLAERTVQGAIKWLVEAGVLTVDDRSGKSSVYTVTPAGDAPPQEMRGAGDAPTPAGDAPPPPQEMHPTPAARAPIIVIDPSVDPSKIRKSPSRSRRTRIPNGEERTPMDLPAFMVWAKASKQSHVQVIGEWAEITKPDCKTKAQWRVWMRRHLQAARDISVFSDEQITAAFERLQASLVGKPKGFITTYTLETVLKFLTGKAVA